MSDNHGHGSGDGHESAQSDVAIIAEKSWQDGLLVLVCVACALGLLWYGFQWSTGGAATAETPEHAAPGSPE